MVGNVENILGESVATVLNVVHDSCTIEDNEKSFPYADSETRLVDFLDYSKGKPPLTVHTHEVHEHSPVCVMPRHPEKSWSLYQGQKMGRFFMILDCTNRKFSIIGKNSSSYTIWDGF